MTHLVAVTGATGYVGHFIIPILQRQGVIVRALRRPESDYRGFTGAIEWVIGDLRSNDALTRLVQGASAVIHLAYEHVPGSYRGGEGNDLEGWLTTNLYGSLELLQLAVQAQVEQFVFLSSRAVFSQTEVGHELNESHAVNPNTHYGAYKAAVEAFLSSFGQSEKIRSCAIRTTGVYGITWPVERSKWWDLVQAVLNDEPITVARGGTEVHGSDVAKVISQVLLHSESQVDVIHMSDIYITTHDLVRRIRHYANRPGSLPPQGSTYPSNPLVCGRLTAMGVALGGMVQFERTIAEMVQIALARHSSKSR
jgi:nucleoside-diphosphate-sugar epimerase